MKKSPAAPIADQPEGRIKEELETIREEEEDDQKMQQDTSRISAESRTLKTNAESQMIMEKEKKKKKRGGWEVGMKKIKNIVSHPLSNLEQKYVQLMTGFAGKVGSPRGTRLPMRATTVPVWEL